MGTSEATVAPTDGLDPVDIDTCDTLGFDGTLRSGPAARGLPADTDDAPTVFSYRLPTGQSIVGIVVDELPDPDHCACGHHYHDHDGSIVGVCQTTGCACTALSLIGT